MSAVEKHVLSNNWNANLAVAVNDSITQWDLNNGADGLTLDGDGNIALPAYIVADAEIVEVTDVSIDGGGVNIDRFTVVRHADGSTASGHVVNTTVWGRLVKAHINEVLVGQDATSALLVQMLGGDITTARVIVPRTYEGGTGGFHLQVIAQAAPDMTVVFKAGGGIVLGEPIVRISDVNSATLIAPTGNDRIDVVEIAQDGAWNILTGTEAGVPSAPTVTAGSAKDAEIYHPVGTVHIDNTDGGDSYITDFRLFR